MQPLYKYQYTVDLVTEHYPVYKSNGEPSSWLKACVWFSSPDHKQLLRLCLAGLKGEHALPAPDVMHNQSLKGDAVKDLRSPGWSCCHIAALLAPTLHLWVSLAEALGRGLLQVPQLRFVSEERSREDTFPSLSTGTSPPTAASRGPSLSSRPHKIAGAFCLSHTPLTEQEPLRLCWSRDLGPVQTVKEMEQVAWHLLWF